MGDQRDPITGEAQSHAFKSEKLCVHVASRTTIVAVLERWPDAHVYEFTVAEAIAAGATRVDDELEPGDDADHAIVYGTTTGKVCRRMKKAARRRHPPAHVEPDATVGEELPHADRR